MSKSTAPTTVARTQSLEQTPEQKTLTKADLVELINEKIGFSKKESTDLVERVIETMKTALLTTGKLKLSGFGRFEVRFKKARRGRNPQTRTDLVIGPHRVVSFKPSQLLKAAVAGESLDGLKDDVG